MEKNTAHIQVPVILIVDDNPQNLQVLGKQLQEKKYEIEFAVNGPAALDWLNIKKFDLILLDINMPGMSGFEVCKKIRLNPELNNVPIIFLSADTDRESILRGFEMGAQDYITKPFDSRELIVRVKTHLSLKETLEKLEQLNRSLEEKVLERTTQLKEANEKLEETNLKLIDLDKAKSDFLNLISHEIRTPLNGILGPLELLKGPVYAAEIGELISILDSSVRRLERFSLDALLITRLKTRPAEIRKESISLSNLFKKVLSENLENIQLKQIKIDQEFDLKNDIITGETDLVKKSITNILDNSIIFSPQNGSIEIKTYPEGNYNVFEIRDHGDGFSAKTKEHMYELFTQADKYRDNSKGIGLPVVKMIIDSHGGKLLLENHPAGGALVKLCFLNEAGN
jgi:two-component system, sensor histidine kinase and response regulator